MKKIIALLLCICMLTGILAGCGRSDDPYIPTGDALEDANADPFAQETEPEEEQDLTLVYYPDRTMDPYECVDYTNKAVISLVYESLFVVDDDYEVHPLLCKNYSVSEDLTEYIFYLQEAFFSDGTPLTATHVVESFNAAIESNVYGARFHNVWDIEALSANAVGFYLNVPYENFPLLLDVPILKLDPKPEPAEGEAEAEDEEDEEATLDPLTLPLGTGPYCFDKGLEGLRLKRVQNWWCPARIPMTDSSISLLEATSPSQVRDAFEFSNVGLVCADPGSQEYADFRCDYELWDIESGIFMYIGFNLDEDFDSIFRDDGLRTALTHAINREQLNQDHYRGYADPVSLPASAKSPYYDDALAAQYAYDKDAFSQAVVKAGAQGEEISLLVNGYDSQMMLVAKDIAEMLEGAGLVVKVEEFQGNYRSAISARGTDLYLAQTKLSPNMDLTPFFYIYGTLSYGALDNEAAYALCKEALENEGNYYSLHKLVMDQGLICPILFRNYAIYATRGLLTGLTPTRDNVFYYDLGTDLGDIQVYEDEEPAEGEEG